MKNSLKKKSNKKYSHQNSKMKLAQIRQLKNKVTNWKTFLQPFRVEQLKKEVDIMGKKFKNTKFRMRSSDTCSVKSKWTKQER